MPLRSNLKTWIFSFILVVLNLNIYCQEFSKNSIRFRTGIGVSMGSRADGVGITYSAGFQRELRNPRFRINPNLSFGQYSSRFVMDARDEYFNSTNLETIFYFDLLKGKKGALVIGAGGLVNNTRGLLGTGGDYEGQQSSEYISEFHLAVYVGCGLRFSSPDKRLAFEFMPFNFHLGTNDFLESHLMIGLEIKL